MADRSLELALRIRAAVQGADSIDGLKRDLGGLADEIEQAANPTDDFNRGLRDLDESGQKAGKGIKAAADPMAEFKDLLVGLATAAAAKQILDLNDQITALKRGFDVVAGSSTKATEALSFVRGVADRLGVSSADLAQSFLRITAAAQGTQLEGAATEKIFSSLAGAMSTVGASAQDVDSAMNAVGQMMSKGVIAAEELRGQLGDVLPGAAKIAADSLLATNAEFTKMLESGQIIASDFLPKFAVELEKSLGGGKGQVESFNAAWNRLMNQVADLATGPIGKGFTDFVILLTDKLGTVTRAAGAVSSVIGAVGTALGGLAAGEAGAAMNDLGQSAEEAAAKLFGFKTEAQAAAERQKQMAAELKALIPEMDRFQDAVDRKALKALPENLQAAVAELKKTGDAVAATQQAISQFFTAANQNLNFDGVIKLAGALNLVRTESTESAAVIQNTLAATLEKLSDDQLERLKQQAQAAMAAASQGSDNARKAFSDLGLIVEAVANTQFKRAANGADSVSKAAQQLAANIEGLSNANLDEIRAEIALARARGDSVEAMRLSTILAEAEGRAATSTAQAKLKAADAERANVAAKIADLEATKTTNAEEEKARRLQLEALAAQLKTIDAQKQSIATKAEETGATATLEAATQKLVAAGYDDLEAKKLALLASGQFTAALKIEEQQRQRNAQATQTETAAAEDAVAAKQKETAAAQASADAAAANDRETRRQAGTVQYLAQSFDQLNAAGKAALKAIGTGYENANLSLDQLNQSIARQVRGLDGAAAAEEAAAKRLERLQEIAAGIGPEAERAQAALADMAAGASGMTAITTAGEQVISTLKSIHQQAQQARQSLQDMASGFEDEILRLEGDQRALLEREYQASLARLEEARRKGGAQSEADYQEAVRRLNALHQLQLSQLREQEAAKKRGSSSSGSGSGGGTSGGGGTTNITVNVDGKDLLSEDQIRRKIVPILERSTRLRA